jgi:dTDP-4-amino-4,6-dideoxygalactose transaminase
VVDNSQHAYYRLYAKVKKDAVVDNLSGEKLRNHIVNQLVSSGVPCFFGSCAEIYREELFVGIAPTQRLPNATDFADNAFCFLVHPTITNEQLQLMSNTIKQVLTDLNKR